MTEESIFAAALARKTPAERDAYLSAVCADDVALRRRVEALLKSHEEAGSFLEQPAQPERTGEYTPEPEDRPPAGPGQPRTTDYQPPIEPGVVIAGRYTLQEKIGEGGMGEVWVAKQTEPVKRRVALKLIKAGMDTKAVLQRFEAERQALAMMDHPNIAKVLDGGMVGFVVPPSGGLESEDRLKAELRTGQPFFVMELVNGLPLTKFCDEAKLGIRERLELFAAICQAVQHAHQKGIIHRDLKPSNILVTLIDARPVPKVIDFGVAKAIGGKLLDESLSTQFGAVVGTLEYMAPEQAGFSGSDIDTRADIYSLGVILYELLTGLRPIDSKRLKKAARTEMIRIIQEEEPSKPSMRLSELGRSGEPSRTGSAGSAARLAAPTSSLASISAQRQIEPKKLMALLRGELDWVVMKCLEKQRDRRYETANGLARDIQRYLADEPVEARPPSAGYRLKKFVRRHKGQVIAAGLIVFALVAGIAGTTWQAIRAESARAAEAERAEGERLAKLDAQEATALTAERLKQIETINTTVFDIFTGFDIRKVKEGPDPVEYVLAQKLVEAGQKLDAKAIHEPLVLANLQNRLGATLLSLGRPQDAIGLLSSALEIRMAKLGLEHPDTLTSMNNLALAYGEAGKLDLALPLYEETLKLTKAKLGPEHSSTLVSMNNLAGAYQAAGKRDLALPLYEETLRLQKSKLGPDHPSTLVSMNNLALAYQAAGKHDLPLFEETLKLLKAKLGPEHPDTLMSMGNLAQAYREAGKLDLAVPLFEETLKLQKAKLGPEHPSTLTSMNNLAAAYKDADLALPLMEETLKLRRAKLGPEHPDTLNTMNNLAAAYHEAGKFDLALPLFEETLKLLKAKLGPEHPNTLASMRNLAAAYHAAGKLDLALPLFEETLKLRKAKLGPEHPNTLTSMNNLARAYQDAGKLDLVLPLLEETVKLMKAKLGPEHPNTLISMGNLGATYDAVKQFDKAELLHRERLALVKKKSGGESPAYAGALASLGGNLLLQKKWTDAEPLLRECLAIRAKKEPDAWMTFNTKSQLGGALLGQKKYADAEPLLLAGYEGMKQREKTIPAQGKIRILEAIERLVQLYEATAKKDDAAKWRKELDATKAAQKPTEKQP